MSDKIIVKDKESFKQGIQYAFVMADLLHEDLGLDYWSELDENNTLSDEFKNRVSKKLNEYFDHLIGIEEKNNWPDYEFEADNR